MKNVLRLTIEIRDSSRIFMVLPWKHASLHGLTSIPASITERRGPAQLPEGLLLYETLRYIRPQSPNSTPTEGTVIRVSSECCQENRHIVQDFAWPTGWWVVVLVVGDRDSSVCWRRCREKRVKVN